ncbi:prolyl oligopeptidase family serine peptidase [Cellulomonas edaphi]|uniref:Prolyl oligopeptidase family serine peptidase n=1 Tax=Cellulomonas edaphi TaxID=3053468 RepID=A0ABT7S5E5_9CELL|nr:prolyl oligopeptidase family serine peptidase [Cellulomons edaphi]MDM7830272.1 prolyl oligopeptidase family serine peptidase [Cellulomons edaphi]
MKKLRLVIALLAALALVPFAALPAGAHGGPARSLQFTLNARVLDSGQQIVSVTLDTSRLGVRASSLTADTFSVHAKGTNPYTVEPGTVFGEYDVDRTVTGVHLDRHGRVVIDLLHGYEVEGASTLAWCTSCDTGRNLVLDLTYTLTQNKPLTLRNGKAVTLTRFKQGEVVDPEVDAYRDGKAAGLSYRLFTPEGRGAHPLVVWLHGGGEGGWAQAQDNDLPLLANRGALGFSTREAQRIFGGAYVLAPQATDYWLNDPAMGYSAKLKALIDKVVRTNHVDKRRIYVVGASNGGYMTPKLVVDNPRFFAAQVPIAPALVFNGTTMISDADLAAIRTPTWVVQSKDDDTLPFEANGLHMADTIPGALLTAYDHVTWDGVTYPGHWSWIYVGRNDPTTASGVHIWQWMAQQKLGSGHRR